MKILRNPESTYQHLARSGGFAEPVLFTTLMGLGAGIVNGVLSTFSAAGPGILASFLVPTLAAVVASFVFAFVMYIAWSVLGSRRDFECAYRCVSPAMAILPAVPLLGLVPYLGTILVNAWLVWMMILASTNVHSLTGRKPVAVVATLGILLTAVNLYGETTVRIQQQRHTHLTDQMKELEAMSPEQYGQPESRDTLESSQKN